MNINIQTLSFDNENEIIDLLKLSVFNGDKLHIAELLPTENNVYNLYNYEIFPIIFDDDPIFGAFVNNTLIGFTCFSTKINTMYNLKSKIAFGQITIIHPAYRKQGIGTKLRTKILQELKSMGIKKFIFEIREDNGGSLKNAHKMCKNLNADADLVSFKFEGNTNVL